jgi:hypothetical protein
MITFESTVLEKLFHEDQPMGGGVMGIWFASDLVCWFDDGEDCIPCAPSNDDGATTVNRRLGTNERKPTANAAIPAAARTDRFSIFPRFGFHSSARRSSQREPHFMRQKCQSRRLFLHRDFRSRPLACASYAFPSLKRTNPATRPGPSEISGVPTARSCPFDKPCSLPCNRPLRKH